MHAAIGDDSVDFMVRNDEVDKLEALLRMSHADKEWFGGDSAADVNGEVETFLHDVPTKVPLDLLEGQTEHVRPVQIKEGKTNQGDYFQMSLDEIVEAEVATPEQLETIKHIVRSLNNQFKDLIPVATTLDVQGKKPTGVLVLIGGPGQGTLIHMDWSSALNVAFRNGKTGEQHMMFLVPWMHRIDLHDTFVYQLCALLLGSRVFPGEEEACPGIMALPQAY